MLEHFDSLGLKARAEAVIKQTADEMRAIVKEMAKRTDFPLFPGTPFQCIEAEPGRAQGPGFGCIVVCSDGEFRELRVDLETPGMGMGTIRREELNDVNMSPGDYIVYAQSAVEAMSKVLAGERIY